MFDRKKFKKFAKVQLQKRWAVPIIMTLVTGTIISMLYFPSAANFMFQDFSEIIDVSSFYAFATEYTEPTYVTIFSSVALLCSFIFAVARIHVYLIMSRGPEPVAFNNFFAGVNLWFRAILEGVWVNIWTYIWSFFFVIPGIVKSIAYSQAFFLITEYPNISVTKALRISIAVTRGYKAELFMMYMSFIGWAALCVLSFGIGFLWLVPYMSLTKINAYHWLVKRALDSNTITLEDLGVSAAT